ncbi:MAG: TetR/AcrR family transcriptional regulator [candidate division Zixibacteria bacterium]
MPPKTVFTKNDVIEAAFEIVQRQGMQALTARKVALELKSSTAPVYSNFESIKGLEREVIKKAKDLLLDYTKRPYTERVFLNMGTGCAIFAREHRKLFSAIFLERDDFRDIIDEFLESLRKEMVKDKRFTAMSPDRRDALLLKMWIFTHGLSTLICVGLSKDESNEYIINTLLAVGTAVIGAAMAQS